MHDWLKIYGNTKWKESKLLDFAKEWSSHGMGIPTRILCQVLSNLSNILFFGH